MSYLHAIETAVPPFAYHQEYAMNCMKRWVKDRVMQRMVHHVYRQSGIEQRFSVLPDFQPGDSAGIFHEDEDGNLLEPTTGQRNQVYAETFGPVAREAARKAFENSGGIIPADVTHVITVSCTGFCNPGPDLFIANAFNLSPAVERYHIGFMGCYAAFPALRMADQFCRANPNAVVLVVCVELCTLHLQVKPTPDSLLANALFSDGAAAALVSSQPPEPGRRALSLEHFATRVIPDSAGDMAWTIGDRGFDMILSSYVPRILGLHARDLIADVMNSAGVSLDEVADWAVHPGGKAILNALENQMGWSPDEGALAIAHRTLKNYGNMSSATILFVLSAIMKELPLPAGSPIGALAFGPGLTVEFGLMTLLGPAPEGARVEKAELAGKHD
ncbi:MAG: type III polyketide synthase [Kiritimatiellia bacterium]|jgi:predicted naringenin-chalcone synthase